MQFKLDVKHLFKEDKKEEKDMYSIQIYYFYSTKKNILIKILKLCNLN